MQGRHRGEIQGRYMGDIREIHGSYRGLPHGGAMAAHVGKARSGRQVADGLQGAHLWLGLGLGLGLGL